MAVYPAVQRTNQNNQERKPMPTEGDHVMTVKFDHPSKKLESQHSFLLENDQFQCWVNLFINRLDEFAKACGHAVEKDQDLDTSHLRGKKIKITWAKSRNPKSGKEYEGVTSFRSVVGAPKTVDEDIPF